MKKYFNYSLHLKSLDDTSKELSINVQNHDDLFTIMDRLEKKEIFETSTQAQSFAIGLKLLTEEVLRNRDKALFEDFFKALSLFIHKIKQHDTIG